MNILITGCAGFIGYHITLKLLEIPKIKVFGIDNMNSYYDRKLKNYRLNNIKKSSKKFIFNKIDICNIQNLKKNFRKNKYDIVIHLAAQAGVRASVLNPRIYMENNVLGFYNILELSQKNKVKHLLFSSTSSVYGDSSKFPLNEETNTDHPLSFYAATKKSNEIMAYAFSNIYRLPCTCLRLFTVYGPYGRPDMSLYRFTKNIFKSKKIDLYNKGKHIRDFTYIDDTVEAIIKLIKRPSKKIIPFEIYNIASSKPESLRKYLSLIEKSINKKALIRMAGLQVGDVKKTHASVKKLIKKINYKPKTNIEEGIDKFVRWFEKHYKIRKN